MVTLTVLAIDAGGAPGARARPTDAAPSVRMAIEDRPEVPALAVLGCAGALPYRVAVRVSTPIVTADATQIRSIGSETLQIMILKP
jgi:hypothetical protein